MTEQIRSDSDTYLKIRTVRGDLERNFPKTTIIDTIIKAVIQRFDFSAEGKYELETKDNPGKSLDPDKSLASLDLKDNDILVFTDLGVAV